MKKCSLCGNYYRERKWKPEFELEFEKLKIHNAQEFAKRKHAGQLDDEGKNYFDAHLLPVQKAIRIFTDDVDVIVASVLHDTLEDTDTTYEELKSKFGKRVADLVLEVTHEVRKDTGGYYFPRLESRDAILIKLCDRASNISRMDGWDIGQRESYLKRTKFWRGSEYIEVKNK